LGKELWSKNEYEKHVGRIIGKKITNEQLCKIADEFNIIFLEDFIGEEGDQKLDVLDQEIREKIKIKWREMIASILEKNQKQFEDYKKKVLEYLENKGRITVSQTMNLLKVNKDDAETVLFLLDKEKKALRYWKPGTETYSTFIK